MFNAAIKLKVLDYASQHDNRAAARTMLVVYVSIIINAALEKAPHLSRLEIKQPRRPFEKNTVINVNAIVSAIYAQKMGHSLCIVAY